MNDDITMDNATKESIRHTLGLYGLAEARHALAMLEAGLVNGKTFIDARNECGCLIGTLAIGRSPPDLQDPMGWLDRLNPNHPNATRHKRDDPTQAAQDWFWDINLGHTPANNVYARLAHAVIKDWCDAQVVDFGKANPMLQPESTKQAIERLLGEA